MTLSLRGRLLIGVISLVVLGLLVSSAATYLLFQNSLIVRIDGELTSSNTVSAAASWLQNDCRVPPGSAGGFPTYTVAELLAPDGSLQIACRVGLSETSNAAPVLPKTLHTGGTDRPVSPITVAGTGGIHQYPPTDGAKGRLCGQIHGLAIPVDERSATC